MQIDTRITKYSVEVTISTDHATITEDVSIYRTSGRTVPGETIDEFIDTAVALFRSNNKSDLDFFHYVFNNFLIDSEKEIFFEDLKAELQEKGSFQN